MTRALVLIAWLLVPSIAAAQLVPGEHRITGSVGVSLATNDLLHATAVHPVERAGRLEFNDVVADMGVDPGAAAVLRYSYNLTQRLAAEAEMNFTYSVLAMQLLELKPAEDTGGEPGEPQFETTTLDARFLRFMGNLSYHFGRSDLVNPFVTVGIGTQSMDLRQKGEINLDPIFDRVFMFGIGAQFHANSRLDIRIDLRNFMYNFSFDNQFVGADSDQILFRRDVGLTTANASPRFQNDVLLNLAFSVKMF